MRAVATAVVDAPIEKVWAALADHEAMSTWGPGIKVTVTKEGAPDRNGVGAVRRIAGAGPLPPIVEEITRFEPGRALGYRATGGVPLKNYNGDVQLTPDAGGTRIEWAISADQRVPYVEKAAIKTVATVLLRLLVRSLKK